MRLAQALQCTFGRRVYNCRFPMNPAAGLLKTKPGYSGMKKAGRTIQDVLRLRATEQISPSAECRNGSLANFVTMTIEIFK